MSVDARGARPAGDALHFAPVAQAARVRQHVPDGERLAVVGQLGHVLPSRVVERQLAFAGEQQHRGRRELLRRRAGLEDRVGRIRRVVLEVGQAVGALQHHLAVLCDTHGTSRRLRVPLRKDGVDPRGVNRSRRAVEGGQGGNKGETGSQSDYDAFHSSNPLIAGLKPRATPDPPPADRGASAFALPGFGGTSEAPRHTRSAARCPLPADRGAEAPRHTRSAAGCQLTAAS